MKNIKHQMFNISDFFSEDFLKLRNYLFEILDFLTEIYYFIFVKHIFQSLDQFH